MKKRVLFIDRDGTLIAEPPTDFQVDSLEKLEFLPFAITSMERISKLGFHLAMVTNQDGLGTDSFPENTFHPAHNKMLTTLRNEGIEFDRIFIDRSFPEQNLPTRKPGTAMLTEYFTEEYDLEASYVIGDRITDVQLAANLGAKAILLQTAERGAEMVAEFSLESSTALITDDWREIYAFLRRGVRSAKVTRITRETDIKLIMDVDGAGRNSISTGIGFFDHMLDQIFHHGSISLDLVATGDLRVDEHHTVEDTALVLGEAIRTALGDKRGIERYGYSLPMDECKAMVLIDFGGRPSFEWNAEFRREKIGDMPTEMFRHFFSSFSYAAQCNLHIEASGENEHHKIEAIFKAFARALKKAVRFDPHSNSLPSSKGVL